MIEVDLFAVIGVAIPTIGLVIEHFHYQAQIRDQAAVMQERIAALETHAKSCVGLDKDVRELMTKVDLFWGALEKQLPGILLKGNPLSPDSRVAQLLKKYGEGTITHSEQPELLSLLEQESASDEHTPGEALAMVILVATMRLKKSDDAFNQCMEGCMEDCIPPGERGIS